jgi:hypothetical protein
MASATALAARGAACGDDPTVIRRERDNDGARQRLSKREGVRFAEGNLD